MDKIIEGIVSGVGAGVVVALILGVYDWWRRRCRREEQIHHMKTVIEKAEDEIRKAETLDHPEGGPPIDVRQICFIRYKALMQELKLALEDRTEELSYQQRYELRRLMGNLEEMIRPLVSQGKFPSMQFYENYVFEALRKLEWIQITPPYQTP